MTDVYSGHSQFILLTENRRRWFDGRTLFLITVVTVPVVIFCGIYTIVIKGSENMLYPKSYTQVPSLLTHRAKIYSNQIKSRKYEYIHKIPDVVHHTDDFKIVCYYNFPSENDNNALRPKNIDPYICTHINIAFATIVNNSLHLTDSQIDILTSVVSLKKANVKLKVLLSVGGAGNNDFDIMVKNHINRKIFIKSVVDFVKNYEIDGVDLDWEFPGQNSSEDKNQKIHFIQLLEEFRMTINRQNRHKFLLTVAVAAPAVIIDNSYNVMYMNEYVDLINVMTYDFHVYTKFTPYTGLNSPLFASYVDKGYFTTLNVNYSAFYWLSKGMNREKIIIGLPTYSHTFRLMNPHNKGLYAPARGYGKLGSGGFADYTQVCKFLQLNQISPEFDVDSKSPYAAKGSEWISFDNEQSLLFKAEYIREYNFGGAMVYSLNSDDHAGACTIDQNLENKPFPLINKIREVLSKNYSIF